MIDTRIDSGIEMTTISVLRQLPEEQQDHQRRSARRRSAASFTTPSTAARTNSD